MSLKMFLALMVLCVASIFPAQAQLILETQTDGSDGASTEIFGDEDCNCYFDAECALFFGCDIGTPMCLIGGKLDGLCEEWQSPLPVGELEPDESRALLSEAVTLYFELYIQIVKKEGAGTPTPEAVKQINNILKWPHRETADGKPLRPVVLQRQPLINLLNNSMERVLGYDFNISPVQEFGNIRLVPSRIQAVALIKATRASLLHAINQQSSHAVRKPLTKFWEKFPNYRPMHTGRCYPHGHPEQRSALECQVEGLSRIAKALVR